MIIMRIIRIIPAPAIIESIMGIIGGIIIGSVPPRVIPPEIIPQINTHAPRSGIVIIPI
jgi:hypothetical protein